LRLALLTVVFRELRKSLLLAQRGIEPRGSRVTRARNATLRTLEDHGTLVSSCREVTMDEVGFLSRPIEVADILSGIRYATAFDSKGRGVGLNRQVRRCKRLMEHIVSSSGTRPRNDSATTLNPVKRALEDRYRRTGAIVEAHCMTCPRRSRSDCAGWTNHPRA